jgi:hypothetical protein
MAVTFERSRFSSNGALSGTTASVTFANRFEFFDWLILDGPLHSYANRYILFSYGGTLPFRYRKYRPQNGSPLKICRGALVIRPKKPDRLGAATCQLLGQPTQLFADLNCWSGIPVRKTGRPANVPGGAGGAAQNPELLVTVPDLGVRKSVTLEYDV